MSRITEYHLGGYDVAAPAQNRSLEMDSQAGRYATWDRAGNQTLQRALTGAESAVLAAQDAAATASANVAALQSRAQAALAANATFLALAAPSNAQVVAQVQRLTKECNALIRLSLTLTADVSDTT